jgi:Family of unknown function (DUF6191)
VSIFFDLFSSGNRHRTEELRRLENTREEEGDSTPGRGPIDLSSGKIVIRQDLRPAAADPAAENPAPAAENGEDAEPEDGDAAAPEGDDGI